MSEKPRTVEQLLQDYAGNNGKLRARVNFYKGVMKEIVDHSDDGPGGSEFKRQIAAAALRVDAEMEAAKGEDDVAGQEDDGQAAT